MEGVSWSWPEGLAMGTALTAAAQVFQLINCTIRMSPIICSSLSHSATEYASYNIGIFIWYGILHSYELF